MDKLHREHSFIQRIWQFMKKCESQLVYDFEFWMEAQREAEEIIAEYPNMTFASDWLASYMKFLDDTTTAPAK